MSVDGVMVLGSEGFIGRHLIEALAGEKKVVGYDRYVGSNSSCTVIHGEFSAEDRFKTILDQYDIKTVYHLISTTIPKEGTADITTEVMDNVIPTLRLMEILKERPGSRLIFVSSGGTVYGESEGHASREDDIRKPICGYGMQKLTIEQYIQFYNRCYDTDFRIARLSNPYGVPTHRRRGQGVVPIFMERLIAREPITLYGDTIRDYIFIDDAVKALIQFGDYEGNLKLLNIGSGIPVRLSDLVHEIEELTGMAFVKIERQPIRLCDVTESVLDVQLAKEELGWSPIVKLRDGILRTWCKLREIENMVRE